MRSARFVVGLVLAQGRAQPARLLLTCLAIMASSAAVTWVVSGYDALVSQFDENAHKFLGRYDLVIVPVDVPFGSIAPLSDELIQAVRRDPGVREVNPVAQSRATVTLAGRVVGDPTAIDMLVGARPPVNGAPPLDPMLVATPADEPPYELVAGRWIAPNASAGEAVLSAGAAQRLGVAVGSEVEVTTISNRRRLNVVGIVAEPVEAPELAPAAAPAARGARVAHTPTDHPDRPQQSIGMPVGVVNAPAVEAVYVRVAVADEVNGYPAKVNLLQVALREGVTAEDFRQTWGPQLHGQVPSLNVLDFDAVRAGLKDNYSVSTELAQAYSATALAALASVFIIFTTLSMGVSERARQYALLRSIALTRRQVGAMIVVESLLLALAGWVGGLLAGQAILWVASAARPQFFTAQPLLGWTCVWLTGASVLAGAGAAAVIPAWQAMRIKPLDSISRQHSVGAKHWPAACFAVGTALVMIAPCSVFLLSVDSTTRTLLYAALSYPALVIGLVFMAPGVLLLCHRFVAPLMAAALRLPPALLASQLGGNLLRTLGATLALASGLALYTSTQIWGHTMLQYYIPGDWLPDALVAFHPMGLADEDLPAVGQIPGIVPDEVLPLAVEQARFAWAEEASPQNLRLDNAVVVGVDARRAFEGSNPLLNLDFIEGDRDAVVRELLNENKCIVTEDFATLAGLGLGDRVPFLPPNAQHQTVEYEIAGVVSAPGWQWVTKFSGVRRRFVRTFTMVFADWSRVRDDFQLTRHEFFWVNLADDQPLEAVEASLQRLAEIHAGGRFYAGEYGEVTAHRPFARLTATSTVRRAITMVSGEVIWGMSQLPLITLAITSLAVVNTLVASVRARRWQFGVLRAVGVSRSQIVRLILAEGMMIAGVALLLSLVFGLIAAYCGVGMSRYSGMFYSPPNLFIPWRSLGLGAAATLALCLLSSAWPAFVIGRTEPLKLLTKTE